MNQMIKFKFKNQNNNNYIEKKNFMIEITKNLMMNMKEKKNLFNN